MPAKPIAEHEHPTVGEGVSALVDDLKQQIHASHAACERMIRESPTKAVLIAMAAGYCLRRLPVRALLVANVRLISALAPPVLLAFGAAKLCECVQDEVRRE